MRISKLEELPHFLPPAYTDEESYRARARIHISLKDRKAGFLKKDSNELIPITSCPRLEKKLNEDIHNCKGKITCNIGKIIQSIKDDNFLY